MASRLGRSEWGACAARDWVAAPTSTAGGDEFPGLFTLDDAFDRSLDQSDKIFDQKRL
jgi:hypothetical protein